LFNLAQNFATRAQAAGTREQEPPGVRAAVCDGRQAISVKSKPLPTSPTTRVMLLRFLGVYMSSTSIDDAHIVSKACIKSHMHAISSVDV
jgi:hypothetical protein